MPTQLQFRRGNTAQTAVFTGVVAELTVDTTKKTIVVHDGVTPGGNPLATMTFAQASYDAANSAGSGANVVAAFNKANSASDLAQAAYNSGNTTLTYAEAGFGKANAANSLAQSAFDKANNSTDVWVRDQANAAFDKANTAYTAGSDAYNFATTGNNTANASFLKANSANVLAQAAFDSGNTTLTYAQSGFGKANAANVLAQASFDLANTKFNSAGGSITGNVTLTGNIIPSAANTYFLGSPDVPFHSLFVGSGSVNIGGVVLSNTGGSLGVTSSTGNTLDFTFISDTANAGFSKANSANVLAQAAFDSGNTTLTYAQAGFGKANSANVLAQAAFDNANTKFNSAGGTISGDTTVTGNLTVTGTTFYANVTNVVVEDNIITLNSNVTGTPGIDAGIEVNRGNQTNTSILWSETARSWEFTNDGTNYNKIASGAFANSAYDKANSANVLAQASFDSGNTTLTYAQAGFGKANASFDKANSANVLAQAAFDAGNTVSSYSSSGYDKANSANVLAQAAFNQANTANVLAQASFDSGNTTLTYAQAGFGKANSANVLAQAAYNSGNTTLTYAQAAYSQANSNYTSAVTTLKVEHAGAAAFTFDQYTGNNATLYVSPGETLGFDLTGLPNPHKMDIRVTANGPQYNTGLIYVAANGSVYSGSDAQGHGGGGTLYWKVPSELEGNTYVYQCETHPGMVGNIVIQPRAQTVFGFAQAAYNSANNVAPQIQPSYDTANAAFTKANSANILAQAAFTSSNTKFASAGGTITGATQITDTTQSTTDTNGALIVDGGVGIAKNLNVGGDAIITGSLTVVGGTTTTSSSTITYANPYVTLHDPTGNTWISSNDGQDIGIMYEYYDPVGAAYVVTGGSGNGTTATLNISDRFVTPVGEVINISGVTPSGFNGSFVVTASSTGSVSFLNTTNASVTTTGALGKAQRTTQFSINSGTWATNTANVAFTLGSPNVTIPTGKYVTVTGCTPDKYNGTYLITSSGPGWIKYTVGGPDPHAITVAGQITLENRHAFSGWANDSGYFEFYKSGNFDSTGSFGGLYGGIKAGSIIASPPQSISAADLTAGGFLRVPASTVYDVTSTSGSTVAQVSTPVSLGIVTVAAANTNVTYTNSATLYIAGAPVAGNNVTMAGNTYALEIAQGKSWFGGDVEFHTANGITFYDGTKQTTNAATYNYSTASYDKANSANILAQAAYAQANSATTTAGLAFDSANAVSIRVDTVEGVNTSQNTYAQAAFSKANTANVLAQAAFDNSNAAASFANTTFATSTYATAAYGKANTANVLAQAAFDSGNTTLTYAQAGFGKANSANVLAQAAFDSGNTTLTYTQASFANANAAYTQANSTQTYATSGYGKANTANVLAQAAFDAANTKFASTGGTISGDTNITGNLTVTGTTFYANTVNLVVEDNIITLNSNVTGTPTQDSGIEVNRGSSTNTALIWSETDKSWEFTNNGTTYNKIASGAFANSAYDKANSANVLAQAAFSKANGAVQTGFTTISANGASITPSSNTDTLTISAATANGINVLNPTTGTIDIGLRNSGVSSGTYGGSTNIPVITFDAFGRATSASNVAVSTTINTSGTTGTGSVAGGGTLTFTGNTGISTYATGSTIYINNTGVQSWNGSTGAVTFGSTNVTNALGFTPANKAGDNFTGAVIATALTSNTSVSLNGVGYDTSNTFTTSSTSQVSIDAFATTTYRSARYFVQLTSSTSYHIIELFMVHDGTTVSMAQYGEVFTGSSLGTFDASITTGTVNLLLTPTNSVTTVKLIKRSIVV